MSSYIKILFGQVDEIISRKAARLGKISRKNSVKLIVFILGFFAVVQVWKNVTRLQYSYSPDNMLTGRRPKAFFVQDEDDSDLFGKSSENWPDVHILRQKIQSYLEKEFHNRTFDNLNPWTFNFNRERDENCTNYSSENTSFKVAIVIGVGESSLLQTLSSVMFIMHNTNNDFVRNIFVVADQRMSEVDFDVIEDLLVPKPFFRTFHLPDVTPRLKGMSFTTAFTDANAYVFVDTNVIVSKGWLEPLVDQVIKNQSTVAVPLVMPPPSETHQNLEWYLRRRRDISWDLNLRWEVPKTAINTGVITPQPAIYEGLFVVSAKFFKHTGGFDLLLKAGGAEAVLWSLKTWMCHGQVLRCSCSKVIELHSSTHAIPANNENISLEKVKRYKNYIAQTFLNTFQKYYTCMKNSSYTRFFYFSKAIKMYKNTLKCGSFATFLARSKSELSNPPPKTEFYGSLKVGDVYLSVSVRNELVIVDGESPKSSEFRFSKNNILHGKGHCFNLTDQMEIILVPCVTIATRKMWIYEKGMFRKHDSHNLCITYTGNAKNAEKTRGKLMLMSCSTPTENNTFQFPIEYKNRCL